MQNYLAFLWMISTASFAHMVMALRNSKGQQNKLVVLNLVAAICVVCGLLSISKHSHMSDILYESCVTACISFSGSEQPERFKSYCLSGMGVSTSGCGGAGCVHPSWPEEPVIPWSPACPFGVLLANGRNIGTDSCPSWALLKLFGSRIQCDFCHISLAIWFWKNMYIVECFTRNVCESPLQ